MEPSLSWWRCWRWPADGFGRDYLTGIPRFFLRRWLQGEVPKVGLAPTIRLSAAASFAGWGSPAGSWLLSPWFKLFRLRGDAVFANPAISE
jgi:hypothetical protein